MNFAARAVATPMAQPLGATIVVEGRAGTGDSQPQTHAAVFNRFAMFRDDLQQAVTKPRCLPGRTWRTMSVTLEAEPRVNAAVIEQLQAAGHDDEVIEPFSDFMGHAGALVRDRCGVVSGVSPPPLRWNRRRLSSEDRRWRQFQFHPRSEFTSRSPSAPRGRSAGSRRPAPAR